MSLIGLLIGLPALAGLLAFAIRGHAWRRALLVGTAAAHLGLTIRAWTQPAAAGGEWLALDAPALLFLGIASVLFLAAAVYASGYLSRERRDEQADHEEEGLLFTNQPEAILVGCLLLFLATMTLVCASVHLGLLWVAIEATTLCSAPLIYFHRQHRSLEAAWKYLLICSVGIALALLGNFFLAAAFAGGEPPGSLTLSRLLEAGRTPHMTWLKVAFVFLLVGYGTKMGLAPLHTWLPDAHSEAPSVVSALLSGALLNCAFLGILRIWQVLVHAGATAFAQPLLIAFGLLSMAIAAVFILGQPDYKRLLAYSSVEHMGILALGLGIGGAGVLGALLHAVNHSLTKAMLFLAAGTILAAYRTKGCGQVRGVLRVLPVTGALWVAGFLAITGTPPFGLFLSKFTILKAAVAAGHTGIAVAALAILALVFVGMVPIALRMVQGTPEPPAPGAAAPDEPAWAILPPLALAAGTLLLGLYLPPFLERVLVQAAQACGGGQ